MSVNPDCDGEAKTVKPPRKKNPEQRKLNKKSTVSQKQLDKQFNEHKKQILENLSQSACDLSPKGSVDRKCLDIMHTLNENENYVTTSSCSGRIALFHSISEDTPCTSSDNGDGQSVTSLKKMKRGAEKAMGWVYVKHGLLSPAELLAIVHTFCGAPLTEEEKKLDVEYSSRWETDDVPPSNTHVKTEDTLVYRKGFEGEVGGPLYDSLQSGASDFQLPTVGTVSLKMEPYVMHVECRTMENAKIILTAAVTDGGYRNSGVIPPGKKIMCGIRCTTGLGMEVPLVLSGHNYVHGNRQYMWELLHTANCKMFDNEKRTLKLQNSLESRLKSV
ncbi:Methyltransferase TYW3, putative [Angomonas deanei]|uniref:tRNA(Phe) 7-[(3-amino-3-carboxypropyl)-4-demethylwyosine(37)-N(4)]-methyltransferase n=1 Tax=Angomonas deanei TaxID=59799 RepID=A0A7G2CHE5_9TRYP|nr:Methyltransferase TYW3, putative [Angomonas deanei]